MATGGRQGGTAQAPAQQQQRQAGPPAQLTPNDLDTWLSDYVPNIADALPKSVGMDARQFLDVAMLAIRRMEAPLRSKILACTKTSILFAIQEAASFGFRLGGSMAEGYLIPYGQECTFQPDYKGFLKLARRSGAFRAIEAVEVFEKDVFHVFRDPRPQIRHEPSLGGDPGPLVHVYAYAVLNSGEITLERMNRAEIDKIRKTSKAPGSPAWVNWYGQMGCKAVLKRLLKRQERSVELTRAIEVDDREFEGQAPGTAVNVAPQRGIAGLKGRLGLDEPVLTPSPSKVYSEAETADIVQDDPEAGPNAAADSEVWDAGRS